MQEGSFGWAISQMRTGNRVARKGWNGRGMFLEIQEPDENSYMTQPYIYITPQNGCRVPWVAAQPDLLMSDWELVE